PVVTPAPAPKPKSELLVLPAASEPPASTPNAALLPASMKAAAGATLASAAAASARAMVLCMVLSLVEVVGEGRGPHGEAITRGFIRLSGARKVHPDCGPGLEPPTP